MARALRSRVCRSLPRQALDRSMGSAWPLSTISMLRAGLLVCLLVPQPLARLLLLTLQYFTALQPRRRGGGTSCDCSTAPAQPQPHLCPPPPLANQAQEGTRTGPQHRSARHRSSGQGTVAQ